MENSLRRMRELAERGSTAAQIELGHALMVGQDIEGNTFPPNYSEARLWLIRAHEQKAFTATYLLGTMYEDGKGTPVDVLAAVRLYEAAVEGGAYFPCLNLARIYALGKGVPQSRELAEKWYKKAISFEGEVDDPAGICEATDYINRG